MREREVFFFFLDGEKGFEWTIGSDYMKRMKASREEEKKEAWTTTRGEENNVVWGLPLRETALRRQKAMVLSFCRGQY
jgi:hypothetical protein